MLKNLLFIISVSLLFSGCGVNTISNSASNEATGSGNIVNASNTLANNNNTASNVNINATNATPKIDNSPKRISFGKGQNWGTSSVTLAPNATQLFVVGAKSGQIMDVEASSKDISINLRKGKAQTTADFGYLNAELQSNGDYVFEVKNTSKKEVKSSIKVTIEGGNKKEEKSEIDESDATVNDDPDALPPPSKTPGKKEN